MRIGVAAGIGALACANALAMAPAPALAAPALSGSGSPATAGLSVGGLVACAPGQPVDGVWVNSSSGGSNYAKLRATSTSSASYSAWLPTGTPTAISLHVGCGGSAVDWESANWTPVVLMVARSETINAECAGGQCTFPSADRAAVWAERHLTITGGGNRALSNDHVTDKRAYTSWAGLDLAFANSAYLSGAGALPRPMAAGSAATANSMYQLYAGDHLVQQTWVSSLGVSQDPPEGALVFYSSSASSGHIAISAGAGEVVSANSSGSPLVREQGYTSIPGYRGWAYPSNMVDGPVGPPPPAAAPHLAPVPAVPGAANPAKSAAVPRASGPAKSAAVPRASGPAPASTDNRWLSDALACCLVLLAMFAAVFAARALLTLRRRYRRPRHGYPPAAAADEHNSAGGAGPPFDAPQAAISRVTPPSPPSRALPLAREPSRYEPPAPLPSLPGRPAAPPAATPATSDKAGAAVPTAGQDTAGGSGLDDLGDLVTSGRSAPARRALGQEGEDRPDRLEAPAISPAGLRLLGLRDTQARKDTGVTQRHEVVLADCRIEAVLAEAPANSRKGRPPQGRGWVASAPYLVWAPLPHDVPSEGTAFACVGAGKEGCLFIDLAATPGPLTVGGDPEAASRLAESLVHQLCAGPAADRLHLVVVADAVPAPAPAGAEWVASVGDLGSRPVPGLTGKVELVFCQVTSDTEVIGLARYVGSAPYRVIPVILADLPGAPWSFTAHPSRDPVGALQPLPS
jgi:hypothetical protein